MGQIDEVTRFVAGLFVLGGVFVLVARVLRTFDVQLGNPMTHVLGWMAITVVITFLLFAGYYYTKERVRWRLSGILGGSGRR